MYEIVVRRYDPVEGSVNWPCDSTTSLYLATEARDAKARQLIAAGFKGKRNAAGVWRLSKYVRDGLMPKRVMVKVFIRQMPTCLN